VASGRNHFEVVVKDIQPAIAEHIERANAEAARGENGAGGAIRKLAGNVTRHIETVKRDTIERKLQTILNLRGRTVSVDLADAIYVCLGLNLSLTTPTVPRSLDSAREMVDAWADIRCDDELTLDEFERLAGSVYRFAAGYADAETHLDAETVTLGDRGELLAVSA
jgi:hypothetical protein